ncbi:hypothetical protein O1L68_01520 [Streptomyces lydicus]|nr:hypothetical protein [Streptomyces lydicus]
MTNRLELAPRSDEAALRHAAAALVAHHEALRTVFRHTDGTWHQEVLPAAPGTSSRATT